MADLRDMMQKTKSFRDERNWKQFQTPRNLAAALAIEASELQEAMSPHTLQTTGLIHEPICVMARDTAKRWQNRARLQPRRCCMYLWTRHGPDAQSKEEAWHVLCR
jgi:hypothetical protein